MFALLFVTRAFATTPDVVDPAWRAEFLTVQSRPALTLHLDPPTEPGAAVEGDDFGQAAAAESNLRAAATLIGMVANRVADGPCRER